MAGIEQHHSIGSSSTVLPHRPRENRGHDEQRRRPREISLTRAINASHTRTHFGGESSQSVVFGLIVIHSPLEPVHPQRHKIYLARVPSTSGRACLVRKQPE